MVELPPDAWFLARTHANPAVVLGLRPWTGAQPLSRRERAWVARPVLRFVLWAGYDQEIHYNCLWVPNELPAPKCRPQPSESWPVISGTRTCTHSKFHDTAEEASNVASDFPPTDRKTHGDVTCYGVAVEHFQSPLSQNLHLNAPAAVYNCEMPPLEQFDRRWTRKLSREVSAAAGSTGRLSIRSILKPRIHVGEELTRVRADISSWFFLLVSSFSAVLS